MSRGSGATILRDRNQLGAFDRIRAIREGKGKRSAFLEDSASDGPESPDPPTPPEPSREDLPSRQSSLSSENAPSQMLDSDSDSDNASARPARRRLVKKSQLNDDKEEEDRRVSVGSPIRGQRRKMGRGLVDSDSSDDDQADEDDEGEDSDDDYAPADAGDDLSDAIGAVTLSEEPVTYRPRNPSASVASPRPPPFAPAMPHRASTAQTAGGIAERSAGSRGPTRATLSVADVIAARVKAPPARNEPAPAPKKRAAPAPRAPAKAPAAPRDSAPAEPEGVRVEVPAPAQPRDPRSAGDAQGEPHEEETSRKEAHVRPMRLKGREGGPRFELAGDLASRLYDHQRDGVRWMWNLQLCGRGGILADDMGLGKTLQVAAFASGLLRSGAARRFLVLAPTTLLPHWHKEFIVAGLRDGTNLHKFAGGGSKADRDRALSKVRAHGGVLLTTYGMVLHNDDSLGAPASEEDAEKVAAASGRGAAVAAQDMPPGAKGCHWDWIVCDEGHKLKNPNAQLPRKVRTLPSSHRLIITGTPIQNHLAELWALYDLCCPGLLGDEAEFRREYSKKIAAGQSRDATQRQRSAGARASEELRNKCKPFMLRREKSSVLARAKEEEEKERRARDDPGAQNADDAPPPSGPRTSIEASTTGWAGVKHAPQQLGTKNDLIVWLPLRPAQERLYRAFLKSNTVRSALNKTGSALSAINILKKICDHPALCLAITETSAADAAATSHVAGSSPSRSPARDGREEGEEGDEEEDDGDKREARRLAVAAAVAAAGLTESDLGGAPDASGKCAFLMSLLRHLARAGHRTLVFSQSRAMLDVLESAARADGHDLVRIDGKVPADERHARVERFQSTPSIPLALLTSQVGGLGLTLTAADRVVIYDPAWNPAADSQSVDRAYRIGQTRDVVVYRLVTCGTVEEKVYRRQVFKGGLSRAGTQDGNHFRYFSADETSQLFEFSDTFTSKTQAELERLHAHQRRWTAELANVEAPVIERLGCVGVSDHDLLFSKEDSTKAGDGASALSSFGGGGGGGGGGKAAGAKDKGGKGARGGWKGVDAGWGGDARLAGLAIAAGSAVAAPPSSFASSSRATQRSPNPPKTTRSKAAERLETLMAQRDKQKMLLSMDGMVSRLPDKGRSIEVRIEALEKEIAAAKAELRAKHGAGAPSAEATKSAAMAALDAHIVRSAPARSPPPKTAQGASEEPRGDGGSNHEVEGAASPASAGDDGGAGDARDAGDAGDAGVAGDAGDAGDEEVDVTAGADDESIAGTDDGDDVVSSPARSTPAPAPPPSVAAVAVASGDDGEDAGKSSDEVFDTVPGTPTGAREVDDLSAMLGGMGVR